MPRPLLHNVAAASIAITLGCGPSHDSPTSPEGPPIHLAGQIVLGTGASTVPALRVTVRTTADPGRHNASTSADATGAFDFSAPIESWGTTALDLVVDAPPGTRRLFHPILAQATPDNAADVLARPFVVPESSTFVSTTFGTATLALSAKSAFTPVCNDTSNANCN